MPYDLAEHRHRFAIWAAARATQRGFTSVKNLRDALEAIDIRKVLADPKTLRFGRYEFDAQQRDWCTSICSRLEQLRIKSVTYGRAAKLVAVYLKSTIIMGEHWDSPFGRNLHPPIDRRLLQCLAGERKILSVHQNEWRSINWTELDEHRYYTLIDQLRAALRKGDPFWKLEEYWQPSDSDADET